MIIPVMSWIPKHISRFMVVLAIGGAASVETSGEDIKRSAYRHGVSTMPGFISTAITRRRVVA